MYYVYDAYQLPITAQEVRLHVVPYINGVVEAIKELHVHQHGEHAHLDIRAENICFDDDNHAILIDIDRCREKSGSGSDLLLLYESAENVYRLRPDWTVENFNWWQLGLLIETIVGCKSCVCTETQTYW